MSEMIHLKRSFPLFEYLQINSARWKLNNDFLTPNGGKCFLAWRQWPSILLVWSPFTFTNSMEWSTFRCMKSISLKISYGFQ